MNSMMKDMMETLLSMTVAQGYITKEKAEQIKLEMDLEEIARDTPKSN